MWLAKLCLYRALLVAILERHPPRWVDWIIVGYCAVTLSLIAHLFCSIHLLDYLWPLITHPFTARVSDLNMQAAVIAAYLLLVILFGWQVRKLRRWAWVQLDTRG